MIKTSPMMKTLNDINRLCNKSKWQSAEKLINNINDATQTLSIEEYKIYYLIKRKIFLHSYGV